MRQIKKGKLHRIIMSLKKHDGLVVDHINKNGLDNRTKNLRVVSVSINNRNTNIRKTNNFLIVEELWKTETI